MDFLDGLSEWPSELISLEQEIQEDLLGLDQIFGPTIPLGCRFVPDDQELINSYLLKKVNNVLPPIHEIVDLNIYETDPSSIQFDDPRFLRGERYFFVERETMSKNGNGKRPRRTMTAPNVGGYWHANTGDIEITDENNNVIGYKKSLTFFQYQDSNNKDRKKAKKGDWIMHEYRLPTQKFERWVVCKMRQKSNSENQDEY